MKSGKAPKNSLNAFCNQGVLGMGKVISLDEYRPSLPPHYLNPGSESPSIFSDAEILDKDYARFPDLVFGILKIREILDQHLHYSEEWKHYVLCLLDQAYYLDKRGGNDNLAQLDQLVQTVEQLKGYLLEEMTPLNQKDFSKVLLLLGLMVGSREQSSTVRH